MSPTSRIPGITAVKSRLIRSGAAGAFLSAFVSDFRFRRVIPVTNYLAAAGTDGIGSSVNDWTGVGTPYVSGGAVGKEALLAEVIGADPHNFGGWNLISQLDGAICTAASTDAPSTGR